MFWISSAALAVAIATASPAPQLQPSDPLALLGLVGKEATSLTFAPLDAPLQPLAAPGKPTVVIAFASWCAACIQEMPRNLADYAKFKDRVTFLGIDYSEPASVARKMMAKYGIAFPVEAYNAGNADAQSSQTATHTLTMPSSMSRDQVVELQKMLPPDLYQKALAVYDARASMTPERFAAYEAEMGVYFEDPKQIAAEEAAAKSGKVLDLPHTFVIDAHGKLVKAIEGYNPDVDELALELLKLGIK